MTPIAFRFPIHSSLRRRAAALGLALACALPWAPAAGQGAGQTAGQTSASVAGQPVAAQPPGERPLAAVVAASSGDTRLLRPSSLIAPVRAGAQVRSGDRVVTGDDGQVELKFLDGAVIVVRPASEFRIELWRYDAEGERAFFSLVRGAMRAITGAIGRRDRDRERDREDFRLNTPTATIGIRGTEFETVETRCPAAGCRAGDREGLSVTVVSGRVAVTNDAGTVEVPQGATLHVRDRATPGGFVSGAPPARARARSAPRAGPSAIGAAAAGTGIAPEFLDR